MKKLKHYFKASLNNIIHNKGHAAFCVLGIALTFIFVTFLIHMQFAMNGKYPPSIHSEQIITLNRFSDLNGNDIGGMSPSEQKHLLNQIKEYENYSLTNTASMNIVVNESFIFSFVTFTSAGFWNLYEFDFVAGRPFTEDECNNQKKCAVITKNLSKSRFHTTNSIGKKIEIQGDEFEIIGVVNNFSLLASPTEASEIWVPFTFNPKNQTSTLRILFSIGSIHHSKEIVAGLVQQFFATKNIKSHTSVNTLLTEKESLKRKYSNNELAITMLVFVFLLIPAVNIISLNRVNIYNRTEEIATRRAFGASRISLFVLILFENSLLTLTGTFIGILLAKPTMSLIQFSLFNDLPMLGSTTLMPEADVFVVLTVIVPLMILFLFIFSGFSTYSIIKRSITDILKGGIK
jgi:ABC-type antimicrobial peptide transport system permease subunit